MNENIDLYFLGKQCSCIVYEEQEQKKEYILNALHVCIEK